MHAPKIIFLLVILLSSLGTTQAQTVIYVDQDAPGANTGTTWTDAYLELSQALADADYHTVLRVAQGTYSPGPNAEDTFRIKAGMSLEGGYAGYGTPDPDARDYLLHETVLDGNQVNYHVLTVIWESAPVLVDGFTVTGGVATQTASPDNAGGGLLCDHCEISVTHCRFVDNTANLGGGIYSIDCDDFTVSDCAFENNEATGEDSSGFGGGMDNHGNAEQIISNCSFSSNSANESGGGIRNIECVFSMTTNCTFQQNSATFSGAGIYNIRSDNHTVRKNTFIDNTSMNGAGLTFDDCDDSLLTGCLFMANFAISRGGGLYNTESSPRITNSLFISNRSINGGGMVNKNESHPDIMNCTFYDNYGFSGGAIRNSNCNPAITNCILWNNTTTNLLNAGSSAPLVSHTCLGGGPSGVGNIDTDPLFADPENDDFHLSRYSPCINRGTNSGAPPQDWDNQERPVMGTVDMGVDEYTGPHTLEADTFSLSQSAGGLIPLILQAEPAHSGRIYCLFGTLSGTSPGIPLPGDKATLPIQWDTFTDMVMLRLNTVSFVRFLDTLDGQGTGSAHIDIRHHTLPVSWMWKTMHFAYTIDSFEIASNPIGITIVP